MKPITWSHLDRYHKAKAIDELIEKWRPKEINRYDENGKTVRVFEPGFGCRVTL